MSNADNADELIEAIKDRATATFGNYGAFNVARERSIAMFLLSALDCTP